LEGEPILTLQEPARPSTEAPPPPRNLPGALLRAQDFLDRHRDDREAYLRMGSLFLLSARADDAATVYWWAARRWPDDPLVLDNWGTALLASGDGGSAALVYDRLLSGDPGNGDYRFNFASALYELGAYEDARRQWRKLLEQDLTDLRRSKVLYNLAMTELALGNTNAALECLEKSSRVQPDNPFALCAEARIFARGGDVSNMVACLEKVQAMMTPEDFDLMLRHPVFTRWRQDPAFRRFLSGGPGGPGGEEERPSDSSD